MDGDQAQATVPERLQTEAAYRAIKRAIITCAIGPGQQVTEEQLADRFGTGRGAVRSALKRLYQEQLVQTISRQRYVVPPITLRDVRELFDMRGVLEPVAARWAAGRVDDATLERLRQLCDSHYAVGDTGRTSDFLAANTEFHVTVARASGNAVMADMVSRLLDRAERVNHLSHTLSDRNAAAHEEHEALVEALAARDGDRAAAVMASQVTSSFHFVVDALTRSPSIQTTNVTLPSVAPA